jgi:hypothetical protein
VLPPSYTHGALDPFPGAARDLDILTAVERLERIEREGAATCAGLILDRLLSCDLPRLRALLPEPVLEWADRASA